jgi:K+-sensing histidine kinase KdpD
VLPSLFEPFRRMEGRTGSASGAGLGLAIARSVAAAHAAALDAAARPAGGLDVRVDLPARQQIGPQPAVDPA